MSVFFCIHTLSPPQPFVALGWMCEDMLGTIFQIWYGVTFCDSIQEINIEISGRLPAKMRQGRLHVLLLICDRNLFCIYLYSSYKF